MKHPESEGWRYLDTSAMQIVLDNNPAIALATAKWLKGMVEAQLAKVTEPPFPMKSKGLGEILNRANELGFVLGNYTQLASKVEFLLEFEKLRKEQDQTPAKLRRKLRK